MTKAKRLNLRSRMRLRYHRIRLATIDALHKPAMWSKSGQNDEDADFEEDFEDDDHSELESLGCPDVEKNPQSFSGYHQQTKVGGGILNMERFNRTRLTSDERVKQYVEGDGGCRSIGTPTPDERWKYESFSRMRSIQKAKESRHVSFPDELPRFRLSAESTCRRKPSTTRTVSSDESLFDRRNLLRLNGSKPVSNQRKQRLFSTKHYQPRHKPNVEMTNKSDGIREGEDSLMTEEQIKFQRSLDNFYRICDSLPPMPELIKSYELSPGEVISSSELEGAIILRPSASHQSLSIHSCESCPQSAYMSEDEDALLSPAESSESKHSIMPSLGSKDDVRLLKKISVNVKPTEAQENETQEPPTILRHQEESIFRKFGRLMEYVYVQNKKMILNARGFYQTSTNKPVLNNESIEDLEATSSSRMRLQALKDKVFALGNRRRNPERLNRRGRMVEFGFKVILNSSPVRNSRAKTLLKRQNDSKDNFLGNQRDSSNNHSSIPGDEDQEKSPATFPPHRTFTQFKSSSKDSGGIFTKFMQDTLIHPPYSADDGDGYPERYLYPIKSQYSP